MIKLLVLDVDGTMTDGTINYSSEGELFKSFNVKDGFGIKSLIDSGVQVAIITGRCSKIVEKRAIDLGITDVYQGVQDKVKVFLTLVSKMNIDLSQTAYMGDDVNDLPCLRISATSFAPADSVNDVLENVDIITKNRGGHGAVRECCDYILKLNGNGIL